MTKYQEYFQKMLEENAEAFESFREVHERYNKDSSIQEEYNATGKPIIEIIREYEDRLCRQSEGSGYATYTGNLAEKFWSEIRREFPLIDRVGIIIKKVAVEPSNQENDFEIKKISMFELNKISLSSD